MYTRAERLEPRRTAIAAALLGLASLSLLFGVPLGPVLATWILGGFYALGLELSRPLVKRRRLDVALAWMIHGLLFSFVPGIAILMWVLLGGEFPGFISVRSPVGTTVTLAISATVIGALWASVHIILRRGVAGTWKLHARSASLLPVGLVWSLFVPGLVWFGGPVLLIAPPLGLLLHAAFRLLRPVRVARPKPPTDPPAAMAPTYTPFRG